MGYNKMINISDGWERGKHQWGLVELNLDDDTMIQCWKDGTVTLIQSDSDQDDSIEIRPHIVNKLIKRLQD